jgi:regulator of cell morphogenesis and NO signaling
LALADVARAVYADEEERHAACAGTLQRGQAMAHGLESHAKLLAQPVDVMTREHAVTAELLHQVEHVTHGLVLPEGACGSWTALYTGLRKLCDDVVAHVHLEETVLFPRALAA